MTIEQLQHIADMLVRTYREEIIRDGDWWFGIDHHDFNIHNHGREDSNLYSVNVYEQNSEGLNIYSKWIDLKPIPIV
jgi:hypothetical protein